ncbi:MAG: RNA polymerase recycling motor HelD [Bacillota bacterium]
MEATNHPDYGAERRHLEDTLQWIKKEEEFLEEYEEILKQEIRELRKTIITLMDERLVAKQQLHRIAVRDIGNFQKAGQTPYFGRIDFQENRRDELENIYIGKYGLHDQEREIPIVVDWRAPIADIYYSGHSKDVSYKAPQGEIRGTMHLKRRYEIDKGELIEIFDERTSENLIEDSLKGKGEFLTQALNKTTQGRLKEIVATIQDQQNKIIRSESLKPLVVQGVAGSGKTTIALHRMAYLIYNNRRNLENANYLIFAPNRLFLNYISDILPDLGVDNVIQTTFEAWAFELLNHRVVLGQRTDQLNQLLDKENKIRSVVASAAKIKGSLLFKKVLSNLLKRLEKSLMPQEDLKVDEITVMKYEKIQEIFLHSNVHLSIYERMKKMREYLKKKLKQDIKEVEESIEAYFQKKINAVKERSSNIEESRKEIIRLYDERDRKIERIRGSLAGAVDDYMDKIHEPDTLAFYHQVFQDAVEMNKAFGDKLDPGVFEEVLTLNRQDIKGNVFQNEDLAPLIYIHIKLFGLSEKNKYTHIVVDEAQDYDEFKISVLRELAINDSFTFVGDLSQGIYAYRGINDWTRTMERVFKEKDYTYHVLTTSYRSTVEIVQFANEIIKKCKELDVVLAEPVFRHGEKPVMMKAQNAKEMEEKVIQQIEQLEKESFSSIAVICKDLKGAEEAFSQLKEKIDHMHLLTDESSDYHGGVVVIPSYLAKGLEFDGVIIWDANQVNYTEEPLEIKLLYICATRALHHLTICYQGELSPILADLKAFTTEK